MSEKKVTEKMALAVQEETLQNRSLVMAEKAREMATTMSDLGITADDLVIPRIMLMQNTSEFVGDGKAKLGDMVNSQNSEVLGGLNTPLEVIPLRLYKTLRIYDVSAGTPKFIRQETYGQGGNDKLPFEGIENDLPVKRYLNFNFFVLSKKDIDKGEAFPFVVSFKSSSMPAGKQLATQLFKMAALGRLPYSQSVHLTVTKEKKDTNYYSVFGIGKGNTMGTIEKQEAEKWLAILASVSYRVDEKEETDSAAPVPIPAVVNRSGSEEIY